jgi:hypothetical protein
MCINGETRVTGSGFSRHGRVEICVNETWGNICTGFWDNSDASVICRQSGFSPHGEFSLYVIGEMCASYFPCTNFRCNCSAIWLLVRGHSTTNIELHWFGGPCAAMSTCSQLKKSAVWVCCSFSCLSAC